MCGRFALGFSKGMLEEDFEVTMPDGYKPRFNFAPGQDIPVIRHDGGHLMQWGFLPPWYSPTDSAKALVNARSETVFEKPSFKEAIHTSRCLIPTQGYYEWRKEGYVNQPYCIRIEKGESYTILAGITTTWVNRDTGGAVDTVAVLTCEPNPMLARLHRRMPVIISQWNIWQWLDSSLTESAIQSMMVPFPHETLRIWPVSTQLNDVKNQGAELMRRSDDQRQGTLPLKEFISGL